MVPLTSAQSDLAARYLPLAKRMARRFRHIFPGERPDIRSIAFVGLCEAARSFEPAVGVDFSTFARHRIRGAMRTARAVIFEDRTYPAGDMVDHSRPVCCTLDDRDEVLDLIRRLPARHRHLCRLLYLDGLDRREAGRVMGLSKSRLSRLHDEAMELMRVA